MRSLTLEFHPVSEQPDRRSLVLVKSNDYKNLVPCVYYNNGEYESILEDDRCIDGYGVQAIEWAYLPTAADIKETDR